MSARFFSYRHSRVADYVRLLHRFLRQGREVTYSSLLHHSVSARREALYKSRGLDIEKWMDLMSEAKTIRREISKIGEDYDEQRRLKDSETSDDSRRSVEERKEVDEEETEEPEEEEELREETLSRERT